MDLKPLFYQKKKEIKRTMTKNKIFFIFRQYLKKFLPALALVIFLN